MTALVEIAAAQGSRLDRMTGSDNDGAIGFDAELGVLVQKSKLFYRVEGVGAGLLGLW